jgi:endonuclease/exonuclease/phosphatase family metal-dependent hydrolase
MSEPSETDPGLLRVLSYNVRYFGHALWGLASTHKAERAIAERLAALAPAPDVICLQEIETATLRARIAARHPRRPATQLAGFLAELAQVFGARGEHSPYRAAYFPISEKRLLSFSLAATGLAVLVNERRLHVEPPGPDELGPFRAAVARLSPEANARICVHVRLRAQGLPLHVFNTHLSLPRPLPRTLFPLLPYRLGRAENQQREARALAAFVRERAGAEPFVVCGDFNSRPGTPALRFLTGEAGFRSAHAEQGAGEQGWETFRVLGVRMQLDHLLFGGGVRWVDLEGTASVDSSVGPFAGLSDHVPVIGRLRCPPRARAGPH